MNKKLCLTLLAVSSLLSGCATNVIDNFISEKNYDGLYLRGVFSWWEANEQYKLVQSSENMYSTKIKLIADGQPYDFKFADADWTPGFNCGYSNKANQVVNVGQSVKANCDSTDQSFKFTPSETGVFEFSIDFSGFGAPKVSIERVSD